MSQTATENTVDVLEPVYELSALDRCDSCGAQAYVRATMSSGELFFCAHHGAEFKEKLSLTALAWHDESAKLGAGRN
jgi:hypothetical protein